MSTKNETKAPKLDLRSREQQEADRRERMAQLSGTIQAGGDDKPFDMDVVAKKIANGTATPKEVAAWEAAKTEGKIHRTGPTPAQRNDENDLRESQRQAKIKTDPRLQKEEEHQQQVNDYLERIKAADPRLALLFLKIDSSLNFARQFGSGTSPRAEAMKNELRRDLQREIPEALKAHLIDINGVEQRLEGFEITIVPERIAEIQAEQNRYQAAIAQERENERRIIAERDARRINPDNALAAIEARGTRLRLRIGETADEVRETIDASGNGMDETAMTILDVHYDAIISALKRREDWQPIEIKARR